jgi:hypothetical protein
VISFATFVVVSDNANSIFDIGKPVLEDMGTTDQWFRNSPNHSFNKTAICKFSFFTKQQHRIHDMLVTISLT